MVPKVGDIAPPVGDNALEGGEKVEGGDRGAKRAKRGERGAIRKTCFSSAHRALDYVTVLCVLSYDLNHVGDYHTRKDCWTRLRSEVR